jgi:hypothetical protein
MQTEKPKTKLSGKNLTALYDFLGNDSPKLGSAKENRTKIIIFDQATNVGYWLGVNGITFDA